MNPSGLMIVVKIVGKIVGKIVAKIVARIVVMSDAMSDATSVGMIAVTIDGRIVGTIEEMTAGKPGGMSPVIGVRRDPVLCSCAMSRPEHLCESACGS